MNKSLVVIGVLILISCGSSKKVTSTKDRDEVVKEVKTIPSKVATEKVEKIVAKTKVNTKTNLSDATLNYIENFAPLAMEEMRKFKIPASITLAQGILESGSGNSVLVNKSNNHFGIKCHKGWKGERVYHDDDEKGECFRKYKYPATSYQDHSLFLTTRFRYASLFGLDEDDYKSWAKGLKKAGYATDPKYPNKLIAYIEKYELYKYDEIVLKGGKMDYVSTEIPSKDYGLKEALLKSNDNVHKASNSEIHIVKNEDTLYSISRKYGMSVEEIKSINNLQDHIIHKGDVLKLKTKGKRKNYHIVQKKETLYSLSKKYNLTVEELKEMNHLRTNNLSIGQELRVK